PTSTPAEEESAAFGAALQALWCMERESARAQAHAPSIETIVDQHVQLAQTRIMPDSESVSLYEHAYRAYTSYLEALLPLFQRGARAGP
ncbi:MAG: hypothetical protein N3A02_07125, partial [Rectinema sp.]|nr:hypothetical protein [Rectinema sp.]